MRASAILPTPDEVRTAAQRLAPHIRRTALLAAPDLRTAVGGEVYLKLESEQIGGSFKLRGALNALLSLSDDQRAHGVVASSAGNHGVGVAIAAQLLGAPATIFVPSNAPAVKREKIAAHGATVDTSQLDYDAAERAARRLARESGATFISPCTGRDLLAGAGTLALEILEDVPSVGRIVLPVGGGGLAGGVGGYVRAVAPATRIVGAQSICTNAMSLALASGRPTDIPALPTLADGLAGLVDAQMLAQGQAALDEIVTVEEPAIADAIAWCARELDLVIEGSAATTVAALRTGRITSLAAPTVVIITGANIDRATLDTVLTARRD